MSEFNRRSFMKASLGTAAIGVLAAGAAGCQSESGAACQIGRPVGAWLGGAGNGTGSGWFNWRR